MKRRRKSRLRYPPVRDSDQGKDGTLERPVTFAQWRRLVRESGVDGASVAVVPGRRIRSGRLRRLGNAVRPVCVTIEVRK